MINRIGLGPAAIQAFEMLGTHFQYHLERGRLHPDRTRNGTFVVIIDATEPYTDGNLNPVLLYERAFNRPDWPYPFDKICKGKARASWRTRMSSREVVNIEPEFLLDGHAKYAGAVYYHGIVAAISGVKDYWDEAWAMMFAAATHAEVLAQMDKIRSNEKIDLVGQEL